MCKLISWCAGSTSSSSESVKKPRALPPPPPPPPKRLMPTEPSTPPFPKRLKSAEAPSDLPWHNSESSSSKSQAHQHKLKVVRVGAVINEMDETKEPEHVKDEEWDNEGHNGDEDLETDEENAEDEEEEEEKVVDEEEIVKEEDEEDDSWGDDWPGKAVSSTEVLSAHSAGELMRIWLSVVPKSLQRLREQPLPAVLFRVCGWNIWLGSVMDLRCFYKFVLLLNTIKSLHE